MKKHYLKLIVLMAAGMLASCGSSDQKTAAEEIDNAGADGSKESVCTYSIPTPDSTIISWTAYKTTDKVAVGGQFKEFELTGLKEGNTLEEAMEDASISIPVSSIWTKNPERDKRIETFFFGVMEETTTLDGSIYELKNGNGKFILKMNGIETRLPFTYRIEDGKLSLTTIMDVGGWNAQAAIDSLNMECKDLHAGPDGVTKLWSQVDLVIKTPIIKNCEE